ncbi:hypothetical protein ACOSQ2_017144 [Xanthoceras sorbifolium]
MKIASATAGSVVFVRHCWLCRATRRNSGATTSKAGSVADELPPVEAMLRSALSAWLCCATVKKFSGSICQFFFCVQLDFLPPRSSNDHLERGIWSNRPPSGRR